MEEDRAEWEIYKQVWISVCSLRNQVELVVKGEKYFPDFSVHKLVTTRKHNIKKHNWQNSHYAINWNQDGSLFLPSIFCI